MFLLDTNHLRELAHNSLLGERLTQRIQEQDADVVLPIVTAEEALRGWLALLNASSD